jgi:hypothetical protein
MALIAVAADKGSPGVTTSSVALAAVWPRPVLLAECDPAGGDLVYWLPAAAGGQLDSRRGLLSLAVAARRGLQPRQVWEHTQKLRGGLDVLAGVTSAEQGAGLEGLWVPVGAVLSALPGADVIADCGRVGADGPFGDLLAQAAVVVLITRAALGDVVRLRDRVTAVAAALHRRGRPGVRVGVVVIADHKNFGGAVAEIGKALADGGRPAAVLGGIAFEPKSADQLRGEWGGKLDRSLLIRTARQIAAQLCAGLPATNVPAGNIAPANVAVADARAAEVPAAPPAPNMPTMAGPGDRAVRSARPDRLSVGPDPRLSAGQDPRLSAGQDPRLSAGQDPRRAPPTAVPPAESLPPLPSPLPSAAGPAVSPRPFAAAPRGKHAEPPRDEPALGPDSRQNGHGETEPVSPRQPPRGEW